MIDFRPGDRRVRIADQTHHLRFSVSSLAEMAYHLDADSPKALADRLRSADMADWHLVLNAVLTPYLDVPLAPEDWAKILPELSALIREGLGG